MAANKDQLLDQLLACGVVAVLRLDSPEKLADIARALISGGVTNVEVTMTTPGALGGIEQLCRTFGDTALIGVGTVLDPDTCRKAVHAGAQFVVSPHCDPAIVSITRQLGKVSVPGAFTPTEMVRAWSAGADLLKVFPSGGIGPNYFRDILAPLPKFKLIPTGGVTPDNAGDWIRAGAACIGAGAALMPKDSIARGAWDDISVRARKFADAVRAARK